MPDIVIEDEMPLWAAVAVFEYGLPVVKLWNGEWAIPVSPEHDPMQRVKPGPIQWTRQRFLRWVTPPIDQLDAGGIPPTLERVAEKIDASVAGISYHRRNVGFPDWRAVLGEVRRRRTKT